MEWVSIWFCYVHPFIHLQIADLPSPRQNSTFLTHIQGCSLGMALSPAVVAVWLPPTQSREQARRLSWTEQECVPIGSELLPILSLWRTVCLRMGCTWTENTAERERVLVTPSEPWQSWGTRGSYPQALLGTRTVTAFLFIDLGLGLWWPTKSSGTKKDGLFPCVSRACVVRAGVGHAQGEESFCNCRGSDYHVVWVFWGVWEFAS